MEVFWVGVGCGVIGRVLSYACIVKNVCRFVCNKVRLFPSYGRGFKVKIRLHQSALTESTTRK